MVTRVPGNLFPLPDLSDTGGSSGGYNSSISDQIDRLLPGVEVKRLFVSGKLTSSNSNELQKVCKEFMVDESACKSFVQHQEFLALKAKKRAAERNTLPNIDWNDEHQVSSLTANKLRLTSQWRESDTSSSCSALCSCWSRLTGNRRL